MFALALLALLNACGDGTPERAVAKAQMATAAPAALMDRRQGSTDASAPVARRYLELRHELQIRTAADAVEAAWRNASQACEAAGCEVLSATLQRDDERRPARATLVARVPPQRLDAFLARLGELGTIGRHDKTSADRTEEVVDIEARIANTTTFRDHLRKLMDTPGAKLKDLIDVERELVRVQTELDSLVSRRKALANQTDKVHVSLSFIAQPTVLEPGTWSPVQETLVDAGRIFARSLSALIAAVVGLVPWLLLLAAAAVGLRAAWRRWKRRPVATGAAAPERS